MRSVHMRQVVLLPVRAHELKGTLNLGWTTCNLSASASFISFRLDCRYVTQLHCGSPRLSAAYGASRPSIRMVGMSIRCAEAFHSSSTAGLEQPISEGLRVPRREERHAHRNP